MPLFVAPSYNCVANFELFKTVTHGAVPTTFEQDYCDELENQLLDNLPSVLWLIPDPECRFQSIWLPRFTVNLCERLAKEPTVLITHLFTSKVIDRTYLIKQFCFDLLSRDPTCLRARGELESIRKAQTKLTQDALWELASIMVSDDVTVFWVLEFIDRCKYEKGRDSFSKFCGRMVDLLNKKPNLKVVITCKTTAFDLDKHRWGESEVPSVIVQRLVGKKSAAKALMT
jgi:hypothetical protein